MFKATHKLTYDRGVSVRVQVRGDYAINYKGDRFAIDAASQLTPIVQNAPKLLKRGGRLATASRKRRKQVEEYSRNTKIFLAKPENQWCPVAAAGVMPFKNKRQKATEIHHKDGREGELLLDQSKWLAVSRDGHVWIHQHPNASRKLGWLI